ncbi:hypothetical protein BHE74_00043389 [Ensete ventricosum]|nr:hypothetical protein BHE74_00043389 [Ensete ventricosum]
MTQLVTATDGFIFPQVGDFYEAVGFDACVLVEYAGLNPFGGLRTDSIPRAGCPVMVVRAYQAVCSGVSLGILLLLLTSPRSFSPSGEKKHLLPEKPEREEEMSPRSLGENPAWGDAIVEAYSPHEASSRLLLPAIDFDRCRLISGGISRGREKEEEGVLFARTIYRPRANSSLAGDFFSPRREKKRFPAHAHPGNPYVFGLAGVDHDVEFPDPMPIVGIFQLIMTRLLFL